MGLEPSALSARAKVVVLARLDAFAEQLLRDNKELNILVDNAGIMAPPLTLVPAHVVA